MEMFTVYVIRSQNSSKIYIGYTKNLSERLKRHNSGRNISTKNRGPWVLVYREELPTKQSAWLQEHELKKQHHGNGLKNILERWPTTAEHLFGGTPPEGRWVAIG